MMRLSGKEISKETEAAIDQIARFTAMLAKYYWLDEHDRLFNDHENSGSTKKN